MKIVCRLSEDSVVEAQVIRSRGRKAKVVAGVKLKARAGKVSLAFKKSKLKRGRYAVEIFATDWSDNVGYERAKLVVAR